MVLWPCSRTVTRSQTHKVSLCSNNARMRNLSGSERALKRRAVLSKVTVSGSIGFINDLYHIACWSVQATLLIFYLVKAVLVIKRFTF